MSFIISEQYSADMSLKIVLASFFLLILNETWIRHSHSSIPIILLPCCLDDSSDIFSCSVIFLVIYVLSHPLEFYFLRYFRFQKFCSAHFLICYFVYFLVFTLSIHSLVSLLLVNIYFIHFSANSWFYMVLNS